MEKNKLPIFEIKFITDDNHVYIRDGSFLFQNSPNYEIKNILKFKNLSSYKLSGIIRENDNEQLKNDILNGRGVFENFYENLENFVSMIGEENLDNYRNTLYAIRSIDDIIDSFKKDIKNVNDGELHSLNEFDMVYNPLIFDNEGYLNNYKNNDFLDEEGQLTTKNRYINDKKIALPIVYGTNEMHFHIDIDTLMDDIIDEKENLEGNEKITSTVKENILQNYLENALLEHHEDASEQLNDEQSLYDFLNNVDFNKENKEIKKELESFIKEWNQKQNVISYMMDDKKIVSLVGNNKETIISALNDRISELNEIKQNILNGNLEIHYDNPNSFSRYR